MRVLIIKTSSLGDIIHTLPALTDAKKALPNVHFDWLIEDSYVEIPQWNRYVDHIIPIALRRWRKQPWQAFINGEIKQFFQQLRSQTYDIVVDAQALVKSALVTRLAKGVRCGYDGQSVRGKFANFAYEKTYFVDQKLHAIKRIRLLFAQALNYEYVDTMPDYGIESQKFLPVPMKLPQKYIIFIHNASWTSKLWPEAYWATLVKEITTQGNFVILPWGNVLEQQRAQRLAAIAENNKAIVLPKLKLSEMATVIKNAQAAVFVDTGFGHLAAALNIPSVSLYGPTDTAHIGTIGPQQIHLSAKFPCAPCKLRKCNYSQPSDQKPACFTTVPAEKVLEELQRLLSF